MPVFMKVVLKRKAKLVAGYCISRLSPRIRHPRCRSQQKERCPTKKLNVKKGPSPRPKKILSKKSVCLSMY